MRQLKYHEKKLLRKVDFLQWKREHNLRELQVRANFVSNNNAGCDFTSSILSKHLASNW